MAFDNETRNRLKSFVGSARSLLAEEFTRQLQNTYGMNPLTGEIDELSRLGHLDPSAREIAQLLRTTVEHYRATSPTATSADLLDRVVREQAFTVLNRLCALRLAESREIIIESIARGYQSKGFQLYARVANVALGDTAETYRAYLLSVFDELAIDLPVLFYRYSPQGRLFPRESALLELLELINHDDLAPLWTEDETIGWIYQYFNSVEERKKMRDESSAPRNSREMAVRNQFFTPRYVVEFLTDNTLGRTWYEMRKGETSIADQCRYFVRRPNEIFLAEGQEPPADTEDTSNLSQEELWKRPVYTLHREQKDPRDLRVLDPAMGSGHFLLYAFDLLETIYREAWEQQITTPSDVTGRTLREDFPASEDLRRAVPELILRHNLHGVDIDPRAVQIAGLALWLRAQKAWQTAGVKPADRPPIRKSNLVVAEPMPGEQDLLDDFLKDLKPALLGRLVRQVFDSMKLAGEAGTLLRVEDELQQEIEKARREWQALNKKIQSGDRRGKQDDMFSGPSPEQTELELREAELMEVTSERFWKDTEERVLKLLREYAEKAENGTGARRRLFAEDAAKGFAFVDLCRTKFDVVVMNPPFGLASKPSIKYLDMQYTGSGSSEVCASFYSRALDFLLHASIFGAISSRTFFYLYSLKDWRVTDAFPKSTIHLWMDLGEGILDGATNETACYTVQKGRQNREPSRFGMLHKRMDIEEALRNASSARDYFFTKRMRDFERLHDRPLCYWVSPKFIDALGEMRCFGDDIADVQMGLAPRDEFRFSRLWWEVSPSHIGTTGNWIPYAKGGELTAYYSDVELVLNGAGDLREISATLNHKYPYLKGNLSWVLHPENDYFDPGLTFGQRTTFLKVSALPRGSYFSVAGKAIFGKALSNLSLMGMINTPTCQYLMSLRKERLQLDPQYQEGDVSRMPWPEPSSALQEDFEALALSNYYIVYSISSIDETDHAFLKSYRGQLPDEHNQKLIKLYRKNEDVADALFRQTAKFSVEDERFLESEILSKWEKKSFGNWFTDTHATT